MTIEQASANALSNMQNDPSRKRKFVNAKELVDANKNIGTADALAKSIEEKKARIKGKQAELESEFSNKLKEAKDKTELNKLAATSALQKINTQTPVEINKSQQYQNMIEPVKNNYVSTADTKSFETLREGYTGPTGYNDLDNPAAGELTNLSAQMSALNRLSENPYDISSLTGGSALEAGLVQATRGGALDEALGSDSQLQNQIAESENVAGLRGGYRGTEAENIQEDINKEIGGKESELAKRGTEAEEKWIEASDTKIEKLKQDITSGGLSKEGLLESGFSLTPTKPTDITAMDDRKLVDMYNGFATAGLVPGGKVGGAALPDEKKIALLNSMMIMARNAGLPVNNELTSSDVLKMSEDVSFEDIADKDYYRKLNALSVMRGEKPEYDLTKVGSKVEGKPYLNLYKAIMAANDILNQTSGHAGEAWQAPKDGSNKSKKQKKEEEADAAHKERAH